MGFFNTVVVELSAGSWNKFYNNAGVDIGSEFKVIHDVVIRAQLASIQISLSVTANREA